MPSSGEYEQAIMDAHAAGEPAPDIAPPEGYEMSQRFQQWLVATMRGEVLGGANMAILNLKEQHHEEE